MPRISYHRGFKWIAVPLFVCLFSIFPSLARCQGSLVVSELSPLEGEWIFVEDQTEGRPLEQINPPMSSRFSFRIEPGTVILSSGHGSGHRDVRLALDGTPTEIQGTAAGALTRYRATLKEGVLSYEVEFVRAGGQADERVIKREFHMTKDGLIVRSNLELTPGVGSVGLYRHAEDIPMPVPARATLAEIAWLVGDWAGTRSTGASQEERWSPAKGGAMLAVSRSVGSNGKMFAFEFLRIMERDGGLVYIAQPNGGAATEFVLSEISSTRAVFDNPRHDYPKRIIYELGANGGLTATIGYLKGGTPRRFEFNREKKSDQWRVAHASLPRTGRVRN